MKHDPELRPARSRAEITRVRQGYVLIFLGLLSSSATVLTLLRVFHVI